MTKSFSALCSRLSSCFNAHTPCNCGLRTRHYSSNFASPAADRGALKKVSASESRIWILGSLWPMKGWKCTCKQEGKNVNVKKTEAGRPTVDMTFEWGKGQSADIGGELQNKFNARFSFVFCWVTEWLLILAKMLSIIHKWRLFLLEKILQEK